MHDPVWTDDLDLPRHPPLRANRSCDVCVVGAGMAGIATAWSLAREGLDVVVLERAHLGAGETHHTSAHLSSVLDDGLHRILDVHGREGLRAAVDAHGSAVDWVEARCREDGIECGFRRTPGYLFLGPGDGVEILEDELEAARQVGLEVEELERVPGLPFDSGPCLRYARQATFHPLRFLTGLAERLEAEGGTIHGDTRVVALDETRGDGPRAVRTADGHSVRAAHVVLATNSPADHYLATLRMVPYRTFATTLRLDGEVPDALFWDTADPYHYVRKTRAGGGPALLVGGGDYQTGTKDEGSRRLDELATWARARFPVGDVLHRWSGQVLEPADGLGLVGETLTESRVWMITGDGGQGLTNGVLGALVVTDGIRGRANPWADAFSPERFRLSATGERIKDAVKVGSRYLEWLLPTEVDSEDDIPPGAGAVVRSGPRPVAVHRDDDGAVHRRSAVCTHAECIVHWDSASDEWHCPCHGSRFGPRGDVRAGPAVEDLGEA